jgi:hypothetical protein
MPRTFGMGLVRITGLFAQRMPRKSNDFGNYRVGTIVDGYSVANLQFTIEEDALCTM